MLMNSLLFLEQRRIQIPKQGPSEVEDMLESSSPLASLKKGIEFLRKSLLESDENVDVKHTLIKEIISRFIRQSLESGDSSAVDDVRKCLEEICLVDMLVPQKLHDWCFAEVEKHDFNKHTATSTKAQQCDIDDPSDKTLPLFSKENVYHAILLSCVVHLHDAQTYQSFFTKNQHAFDELSMSDDSQDANKVIERYLIARKDKTFFVAFCGEAQLSSWQEKYVSLDEGMAYVNFIACLLSRSKDPTVE